MIKRFGSMAALSQQWVDKVEEGDKAVEADIRKRRGDKAADRHRARSDRFREKMQRRVDPELTRLHEENEDREK